jgi:perosamine synthetase
MIRVGRTLPPAASPIRFSDILTGVGSLLGGAKVIRRFEEEFKETYCVRHCFTVSSGKAALVLILEALHELFPDRDEVLIPAYTCYSVPSAIVNAGLKVRLCDLACESLDFNFDRFEELLNNPRLLCVIPTHLFGVPADVERIKKLVNHRDVYVVEDAAQTLGGEWNGRKLGTLGDVGLFSLGRGKAFSTVEGGIILTDNDSIGRAIENRFSAVAGYSVLDCFKLILYAVALSIFINPWIYWLPNSLPFLKLGETHFEPSFPIRKLSAFQAGLAKSWRRKIDGFMAVRLKNARKIAGDRISPLGVSGSVMPSLIRYPILISDTDTKKRILMKSKKEGLGISDGYPDSINGIDEIKSQFLCAEFPEAKRIAERIVSLPLHSFVNERDIQKILKTLGFCRMESSAWGGVLLAVSLFAYVASYAGGLAFPARVAMVFSLAGLVWFGMGTQYFNVLTFPIGFLLFIVPVPYSLIGLVSQPLQLIATKVSAALIQECSIPVYREGNMLYFVQAQLEVAEACSGIRSIMAMTMLSLVFCFLSRKGWWRKSLLIAAAIPIAFVANIVRVTGTGILAHFFGAQVARGFLHEFSGLVVFAFGLVLLFGVSSVVNGKRQSDVE